MVFLPKAAQLLVSHIRAQVERGDSRTCTNIPQLHRLIPRGGDQLGTVRTPTELNDTRQKERLVEHLNTQGKIKDNVEVCGG